MSKKLRCTVTGKVFYLTDQRYAKLVSRFGGEEELKTKYVSQIGKKVKEGSLDHPPDFKNRINCRITGASCYISNSRMEAGVKKYGSIEEFQKHYVCREAARLLRMAVTVDTIKEMAQNGQLF